MAKPMLPTKAWAVVHKISGCCIEVFQPDETSEDAMETAMIAADERLARVTITEGDGWQDPKTIPLVGKEKIHVVDRLGNQALVFPSDLAHAGGLECVTAPDHDILTIVGWQPLPAPPRRKR